MEVHNEKKMFNCEFPGCDYSHKTFHGVSYHYRLLHQVNTQLHESRDNGFGCDFTRFDYSYTSETFHHVCIAKKLPKGVLICLIK